MKSKLALLIIVVAFAFTGCTQINHGANLNKVSSDEAKTELLYNNFIEGQSPNIAQLNLFLTEMPKGGDIHHHFSGSIYVETYLDWAKANSQLIDTETLKISEDKTKTLLTVDALRSNAELYRRLLTLWSDKDYSNHYQLQLPPDANFFNTFGYFGYVSQSYEKGMLVFKKRAIKENVSYIETMIKSVGYSYPDPIFDTNVRTYSDNEELFSLLDEQSSKIDGDNTFTEKTNDFTTGIKTAHENANVDDEQFMMRYQTYTSRNSVPSKVFSALYAAFQAADQSELIVGVNLVGPENGVVAIEDYELHMQFFSYLRKKYPEVNVALHAGELTLGMVRPKNLTFHVDQAVNIAGAQRIGHGVDLPYEEDAIDLLRAIKEKAVVEINFTSNEFILGVKGQEHPYLIYSAYGVPIVICTDDSGVSRNNLSHEYVLLATRYKPSYQTIKQYAFNSIKYSFLPNKEREKTIISLTNRFKKFESEMAIYSDQILKGSVN
ncbi:amidohydrolase family protein [Desulfotalea psychrophila]|uniref:adenosine deaminase n=1 Tax=Desulfotalea psychrophila (strain LSv54 / DSM 12343) TaxID=177439 RepID=Q6ALG5_DESPS|nr:adenosine deaminase [Desulfotalea psychrophila]CAG36810.1 related to adenosine deaminase [Desulfotalea psychrophila LSv54]